MIPGNLVFLGHPRAAMPIPVIGPVGTPLQQLDHHYCHHTAARIIQVNQVKKCHRSSHRIIVVI